MAYRSRRCPTCGARRVDTGDLLTLANLPDEAPPCRTCAERKGDNMTDR